MTREVQQHVYFGFSLRYLVLAMLEPVGYQPVTDARWTLSDLLTICKPSKVFKSRQNAKIYREAHYGSYSSPKTGLLAVAFRIERRGQYTFYDPLITACPRIETTIKHGGVAHRSLCLLPILNHYRLPVHSSTIPNRFDRSAPLDVGSVRSLRPPHQFNKISRFIYSLTSPGSSSGHKYPLV